MNGLDIILGIPLIYAAYRGFREGIILQLGGIIGLLLGVHAAYRYGRGFGEWLGLEDGTALVAGFLCIVVLVLLAIALLGRLTRGLCRISGLGMFDQVGGLLLSVAKMGLILSVLLLAFDMLNKEKEWVAQEKMEKSLLYEPVRKVSEFVFPYLYEVKELLIASGDPIEATTDGE